MALNLDLYQQSQSALLELKSRLPEDAVEALAREVISRVADRAQDAPLAGPSQEQIEALCDALLSSDPQAGADHVRGLREGGVTVEQVYLDHLARAARLLGALWDSDHITFVEVTLGTSRIFAIVRALQTDDVPVPVGPQRKAMFAAVPGETHTIGVRMAADLFRKDGWDIDLKVGLTHEELVAEASQSKAVIIGLSAAGAHALRDLSRLVVALRLNDPHKRIFVSGAIVGKATDTLKLMPLDGMAADYHEAKDLLERMWLEAETQTAAS